MANKNAPENLLSKTKTKVLGLPTILKIVLVVAIVGAGWFFYQRHNASKNQAPVYQTAQAQKGTLVVSVATSGQVTSTSSAPITTQASGVVKKLYVADQDSVVQGQKIADMQLDQIGSQKNEQSLSSYQSAKNAVDSANSTQIKLQSTLFQKWKTFNDLATNSTYQNADGTPNTNNRTLPQFIEAQAEWLGAEADYKNQQSVISQTNTALAAASLSLQQVSPTIIAPISGKISGLSLVEGVVISPSTTTTNIASTKFANVITDSAPMVSVNLTEIDVLKIKIGDVVTITFDAQGADKTYTGKVVSVDTVGVVTSGVTNYPTLIQLDDKNTQVLPNMAASASIIVKTKDNVIMVPNSAVHTQGGQSYVQVMKNGQPTQVDVTVGDSSDSNTEIVSGISEGDMVITSVKAPTTSGSSQTVSPFSGLGGRGGGFGGGGVARPAGGGGGGGR